MKMWQLGKLTMLHMARAGWLGSKISTQTYRPRYNILPIKTLTPDIMKTSLFKYTENFTTKKMKIFR